MSWSEEFAQDYDLWASEMAADAPFYVQPAQLTEGFVVELAVGSGRVAIPVAEAIGRPSLGLTARRRAGPRARSRRASER